MDIWCHGRRPAASHSPLEPSVTLAAWEGDRLTVYDSSQGVYAHRPALATAFGIPQERIRMISSLLCGAFGNKSWMWGHTLLAPLAALVVRRPVRLDANPFALATFAAHFTEVRIDRELSRVRVIRHIAVFDCGRVLNARTAENQARGGIIFAIGGALMEQLPDPVSGRLITPALTDYHVPVHADIGDIRARFVDEAEPDAHPVGAKGLGEIASVGVAPAIANAVFHATGHRVRELPITPEKFIPLP
ncbi:molybdopterin cofactor-binding domain-containing protein [Saccharopolyspora sp. 5N708]|uniref:molybdopterin cofactor-binding domain-containing protein n=1 Tax=Saccharopolyspora sp. 5N708 TaxID=3457424 RepID=UPI003FD37E30